MEPGSRSSRAGGGDSFGPVGIIDIGSNSVRFVAYGGHPRVPSILFNEKVMAGLGSELESRGVLAEDAMDRALLALRRFRALAGALGLKDVQTVATAAVRDAGNGTEFLQEIAAIGFQPLLITGAEEARLAGLGVLSGTPEADGIAGDLGGGSLELIRIAGGEVGEGVSLPLGVLRVPPERARARALAEQIGRALAGTRIPHAAAGRPLYLVGGSWRSLGQINMHLSGHPLPIVHQHRINPDRVGALRAQVLAADRTALRAIPALSSSRIPTLPVAAALLDALTRTLKPSALVVSAYGLREGLLFRDLDPATRALDPLLSAAREVGSRYGRFEDHGDLIDRWIAPIFEDRPDAARLRLAACLLADIAWGAHPDFRAERAVDMAVHGNWVGIDSAGRAMLGLALFCAFAGTAGFDARIEALCTSAQAARARQWGVAIRLAQRLSGGVATPLEATTLARRGGKLVLGFPGGAATLGGEAVARRHKQLAAALGLEPVQA